MVLQAPGHLLGSPREHCPLRLYLLGYLPLVGLVQGKIPNIRAPVAVNCRPKELIEPWSPRCLGEDVGADNDYKQYVPTSKFNKTVEKS